MTPSLVTLVRRALEGEARAPRGATLLVAVSGGPDSMALLDALARLAPRFGLALVAHGVDHGLRAEAPDELDLAASLAGSLGVPFSRTRVSVARGGNLQARAREARYDALAAAAREAGASILTTGHHADDRAETLLMRLLGGAGARGLAVLPPRAALPRHGGLELVRPLLRARRADVRAHLARRGIAFASDPSNEDPRFLRARVRRELLPLLEALGPGVVSHLEALADQLNEARERDGEPGSWPAPLPRATRDAVAELMRSRSPSARVWLPGGLVISTDPRARPPATHNG